MSKGGKRWTSSSSGEEVALPSSLPVPFRPPANWRVPSLKPHPGVVFASRPGTLSPIGFMHKINHLTENPNSSLDLGKQQTNPSEEHSIK